MTRILYLASSSPRRKELVQQMGLECRVLKIEVEEIMDQELKAVDLAINLSELKMNTCREYPELYPENATILTADTLIALDEEKLGKAETRKEAAEMLRRIQGRSHQVITAFSIYSASLDKMITDYESTEVSFSPMNENEINNYLETKEWKGVAGAYRIQEQGGKYISSLNGTFYNVMGLPINKIYGILSKL